ncbi:Putative motility protein [Lachnospiraceae bacterium C7]|nr:Putative motility protein [Lachnospiraceae bacterium C7]
MDIAEMGTALAGVDQYIMTKAASNVTAAIETKMMANSIDAIKEQGSNMIQMMEQSVNPGIGANIDVRI